MVPPRLTVPPVPLSAKGPAKRIEVPGPIDNRAVWVMLQGPPFVEIRESVRAKLAPVKWIPETLFVLRAPPKRVVPAPVV